MSKLIDSTRDIDEECGYPTTITIDNYQLMYDREGIASRVVSLYPQECWQTPPEIHDTLDADESEFEKELITIAKKHNLWSYLERIDELSGIGRFGVLLLGLSDGKELHEEVEQSENLALLFLRPFGEAAVTISTYETDTKNPRYGLPTAYELTLLDATATGTGTDVTKKALKVHHSRIVHIADNRKDSEVFGIPRMKQVFNRLYDLRKLLGGSAEMFWKGAYPGYSFEVNPDLADVELDATAMKEEFEKYSNGLQRFLAIQGVSAKSLAPQVADPNGHFEVLIKAIAISLGVPWRILLGTEEAKLAGSQDQTNWNRRLGKRRENYLTPFVIRPIIDRLVELAILPPPTDEEYDVAWQDLNTVSDKEKAQVATERTKALAQYVTSQIDALIPPKEFLTTVMGMEEGEADAILEEAMAQIDAEDRLDLHPAGEESSETDSDELEDQEGDQDPQNQ